MSMLNQLTPTECHGSVACIYSHSMSCTLCEITRNWLVKLGLWMADLLVTICQAALGLINFEHDMMAGKY